MLNLSQSEKMASGHLRKNAGSCGKTGGSPYSPHSAHMRVDKKDGSAERFWNFYDIYTQQWTRTTNHKSDES
jgi:hypothetical protein